ncbi:MAG: hypothetical protein HRU19_00060 [Pseudobacteriovorax sp.]|nr:hypothetical protein [Pseudobacteriovorax sp.]
MKTKGNVCQLVRGLIWQSKRLDWQSQLTLSDSEERLRDSLRAMENSRQNLLRMVDLVEDD